MNEKTLVFDNGGAMDGNLVAALMNGNNRNNGYGNGYDCVYVANMARADYWGSSIADEQHLALFVKDFIDDEDAYPGLPFTRYFADLIGSGTNVPWEDVL